MYSGAQRRKSLKSTCPQCDEIRMRTWSLNAGLLNELKVTQRAMERDILRVSLGKGRATSLLEPIATGGKRSRVAITNWTQQDRQKKKMAILQNCCGFLDLRTGSLIIGYLQLASETFLVVLFVTLLAVSAAVSSHPGDDKDWALAMMALTVSILVLLLPMLALTLLFIIGVHTV
ncbi:hypothetical protein EVAR_24682_1 [Eumeta japonica]|uniref:Uncharacterized protein n=1 Tax=Eumeta variegata TaxID=151549 RepID=A0A4C1WGW8_EUMVA|nr:hypothetical protein EVAR_24682_1 [Eumeta japonica]